MECREQGWMLVRRTPSPPPFPAKSSIDRGTAHGAAVRAGAGWGHHASLCPRGTMAALLRKYFPAEGGVQWHQAGRRAR